MRRLAASLVLLLLLVGVRDALPLVRVNLDGWSRLRERHRAAPDITWDNAYGQLALYLPPQGRIGLVQTAPPGTPLSQRQYYFLQYALAPRLVEPGAAEEFVVAYPPAAIAAGTLDVRQYSLVKNFADDFALYRRTAAR